MEQEETNPSESYVCNIDTILYTIKNKLKKIINKNPYTNKNNIKLTPSKKEQLESIQNTCENQLTVLNTDDQEDKRHEYYKILKELAEFIEPSETIDEQLADLNPNKEANSILSFDWDCNYTETFHNVSSILIGPTKSGKSYLNSQLLYEIPHSFDKICFFEGSSSWNNKSPQVIKHVCELCGMKVQWINTDSDTPIEFNSDPSMCYGVDDDGKKIPNVLNPDGSSKFIYNDTTYPSIYIFDDLYTKPTTHCIFNFIESIAVMGRHSKISWFYCAQGFTRLSNKILDNCSRIFIHNSFLTREDLWK